MSVLDTFYILFKTDAKDVTTGTKKAGAAVDKLDKGIGGADKASISMGKSFNKLATAAVAAFGSVFAVTQLISQAKSFAQQSTSISVLAEIIGASTTEIMAYGRAVENVGGSQSAFQSGLRGIQSGLSDLGSGTGPNALSKGLAMLGTSAWKANGGLKKVLDLLPEIALGMQLKKFSRDDILRISDLIGVDDSTLLLLAQGKAGMEALVDRQRDLMGVTSEDIEALRMLDAMLKELRNSMDDAGKSILVDFLPHLIKLAKVGFGGLSDWIEDHGPEIKTFLKGAAILAGIFLAPVLATAAQFVLLGAAVAAVAYEMGLLWEWWERLFDDSKGPSSVEQTLQSIIDKVEHLRGLWPKSLVPWFEGDEKMLNFISRGKVALDAAGNTPVNFLGGKAAADRFAGESNRSFSLSIGEISLSTMATDAAGIVNVIASELQHQMQRAVDSFDDGLSS